MQTTNNNIKIVRLQSGEDIIADYVQQGDEDETVIDRKSTRLNSSH